MMIDNDFFFPSHNHQQSTQLFPIFKKNRLGQYVHVQNWGNNFTLGLQVSKSLQWKVLQRKITWVPIIKTQEIIVLRTSNISDLPSNDKISVKTSPNLKKKNTFPILNPTFSGLFFSANRNRTQAFLGFVGAFGSFGNWGGERFGWYPKKKSSKEIY